MRRNITTQGGVGGGCNSKGWSFYSIVQTILIGFSTEFLYVKILALGRGFIFLSCESD